MRRAITNKSIYNSILSENRTSREQNIRNQYGLVWLFRNECLEQFPVGMFH
jgi:hypothetical protein